MKTERDQFTKAQGAFTVLRCINTLKELTKFNFSIFENKISKKIKYPLVNIHINHSIFLKLGSLIDIVPLHQLIC